MAERTSAVRSLAPGASGAIELAQFGFGQRLGLRGEPDCGDGAAFKILRSRWQRPPARNNSAISIGDRMPNGTHTSPMITQALVTIRLGWDPRTGDRYSRQIRFARVGAAGQQLIRNARVAITGCGALGSVQAELLARAGAGYIRIIDRDFVERSNLQRQFLFDESDAADALPKAVAAAKRLAQVNSGVVVEPVVADLTAANAENSSPISA